jgi:hypothetical protein
MKRIIMLSLMLAGCYTPPWKEPSKLNFDNESDLYTCMRIGQLARLNYSPELEDRLKQEREKRGLLPDKEYEAAKKKSLYIGGSQCLLYASWGWPDRVNDTETRSSIYSQHVYRHLFGYGANYVYTENGVITAIQNN